MNINELAIEGIIWVDEVNGLRNATCYLEGCKVVGIDCEWKPNYEKGSKPNKVAMALSLFASLIESQISSDAHYLLDPFTSVIAILKFIFLLFTLAISKMLMKRFLRWLGIVQENISEGMKIPRSSINQFTITYFLLPYIFIR